MLTKNDKVLGLKRENTGWMDGFYSFPAGAIDGNETLISAAIRETKEEVGIEIKSCHLKLFHTMHCLTERNEWLGMYFVAKNWKGTPKIMEPEKHEEIKWFKINTLPSNTIPYVKQAIKNYLKQRPFSDFGW